MMSTPRGLRLHLGFFGRRNAGKSSLVNALVGQQVSIVSPTPGTTTDPVEKAMELLPLGPVVLIDTAGIDDQGDLGAQRVERSEKAIERTDLALLVVQSGTWSDYDQRLLESLQKRDIPTIVVFSQCDRGEPDAQHQALLDQKGLPWLRTSAETGQGIEDLRRAIIEKAPEEVLSQPALAADLLPPGGLAVLVVPIDLEAPKGRLILPQVQTIRDLLDNDCCCLVVKERELRPALDRFHQAPDLVITDSQAFLRVAGDVPPELPLTSFSILFARFKGDLPTFAQGTRAIEDLQAGSRVLIAETCAHHAIGDDIGRIKIPRWLTQYVGAALDIQHVQGRDFPGPDELASYDLVVQCGSCMANRRSVLSRIQSCREVNVPITNYGMCISYSLGIFERALAPFPGALL